MDKLLSCALLGSKYEYVSHSNQMANPVDNQLLEAFHSCEKKREIEEPAVGWQSFRFGDALYELLKRP